MLFVLHMLFALSHLCYLRPTPFSLALQETINRNGSSEAQRRPTECLKLCRQESALLEGLHSGARIVF